MSLRRQRGMTMIGGLLTLVMVGFTALMAVRIVPIYTTYYNVRSALQSLSKEPQARQMSLADMQRALQRRFEIGYVDIIQPRQVRLEQRGKDRVLALAYEDRRPLIANLDIVASFDINFPLSP